MSFSDGSGIASWIAIGVAVLVAMGFFNSRRKKEPPNHDDEPPQNPQP